MTRPPQPHDRSPHDRPLDLTCTGRSRGSWRRISLAGLTALTAYSTAISWQAQVSYPLYRAVSVEQFAAYHQRWAVTTSTKWLSA